MMSFTPPDDVWAAWPGIGDRGQFPATEHRVLSPQADRE